MEPDANKIAAFREYTKQAILAASAINSGALVAALASVETLTGFQGTGAAFVCWTLGLSLATLSWIPAYLANAAYTHSSSYLGLGEDGWVTLGIAFILGSIILFCVGGWFMSGAFQSSS